MSTLVSTNLKHSASVNNNIVLDGSGNASFQAGTAAAPSINANGDTNTGIYFPASDTIGFTRGGVQVGEFDSSANFKFNSGFGSVSTAYACRAWVNFNGTTNVGGFCTINGSGNITSVTDNGVGNYTLNFTNSMPDTNYSLAGISLGAANGDVVGSVVGLMRNTTTGNPLLKSTSAVQIAVFWVDRNDRADVADVSVQIFR